MPDFVVALLAKPWFKYVVLALGLVAGCTSLSGALLQDGHPTAAHYVSEAVAAAAFVLQYLAPSGSLKVSRAHVEARAANDDAAPKAA